MTCRSTFSLLALGLGLGLLPTLAMAQWSSDPGNNLSVADRAGGQVQPKLVGTADGGFYVSWFGNGSDGFDVYLQRLAADGSEVFAHNGITVADRDFSSTQDYGLAIDAGGDALLAYCLDDTNDVPQIAASKVAADGSLLWGDAGIVVSNDPIGANSPRIVATSDGGTVVAWSGSDGTIVLQKLDASGAPRWGDGVILTPPPSSFFLLADLQPSDDGSVIASWSAQLSFADRELWTQKFASADGAAQWGDVPVRVFDGTGGAMQFGYFPSFVGDGSGGAVFVFYTVNIAGTVHAQHVLPDGSFAFAQNGIDVTADTASTSTEPAGAYDPASGDIYAIWRIADASTQSQVGIQAQRIDSSGALAYGDTGVVLAGQSPIDQSQVGVVALAGGGALFSWTSDDFPNPMPVHVERIDAEGIPVFTTPVVDLKTSATDTARLGVAASMLPFAAYVWEDDTGGAGAGVIKAQDISYDGVLGPLAGDDVIFADGFDGG